VTFQFPDETSASELADLYKILLSELNSYAFDTFVINKNTTFDEDAFFAAFLENVLIFRKGEDDAKSETGEFIIKVKGPKIATSSDILRTTRSYNFEVVKDQPLFYVRENEEIEILMYTKYSNPRDHSKFALIEEASVDPREGAKTIRVETVQTITPKEAIDSALIEYNKKRR
jgi:hypothetical protein